MLGLGFGFVEVGTVTPRPQAGNPKPRLFRLDRGPRGHQPPGLQQRGPASRLRSGLQRRTPLARDHRRQRRRQQGQRRPHRRLCRGRARDERRSRDYLTINISSPNTPGLRGLQDEGALDELLAAIAGGAASGKPIFLKVAPDLERGRSRADRPRRDRPQDRRDHRRQHDRVAAAAQVALRERGGRPVGRAAEAARARRAAPVPRAPAGGEIPLIGVGGIATADDAWERIRAGASLIQLYTAMVYEGPGIARRIALGLAERLKREGFGNIAEAGRDRTPSAAASAPRLRAAGRRRRRSCRRGSARRSGPNPRPGRA